MLKLFTYWYEKTLDSHGVRLDWNTNNSHKCGNIKNVTQNC